MASTMSFTYDGAFTFPPSGPTLAADNAKSASLPFYVPSPPGSNYSEPGLDFDLESFTHTSPASSSLLDDTFAWDFTMQSDPFGAADVSDVTPVFSSSTPASTTLISPQSSISSFADVLATAPSLSLATIPSIAPAETAEALSNHHLQRYLHYKALAAQAEADARVKAQQEFDTLLAQYSMPVFPSDNGMKPDLAPSAMLGYPSGFSSDAGQIYAYNPQEQAHLANAQAEAHLQAHDVALARAEQQRAQTGYWVAATQNAFINPAVPTQPAWVQPAAAPLASLPLAPASAPNAAVPITATAPILAPVPKAFSAPSSLVRSFEAEGEEEVDGSEHDQVSVGSAGSADVVIPNLNGGGRGYVPGQTPDDPKKRHKCNTCGRAFARAFNLKVSSFST